MSDLASLRPKPTERMLIVGATGTGKTTLARELLRGFTRVLVIDPKCTYEPPPEEKYKLVRNLAGLRFVGNHRRIHYRPSPGQDTVGHYDAVYRWAYERRDIMVYTDETFAVMHHAQSPDWLRAVVTMGRERGTGCIFATQRPSGIDLRIYTESEHKVCFYLAHTDDRKRMSQEMGKLVMTDPVIAAEACAPEGTEGQWAHAFWRWDSRSRKTRLAQLDLKET